MNNNQGYELFSAPEDQPIFSGSPKTWDDALKPKKTIQLAASGEVMITTPEMEIIDTRSFQRLRRVRQLGAACVVSARNSTSTCSAFTSGTRNLIHGKATKRMSLFTTW